MAMDAKKIGLVVGAILVVIGIALVLITEPEGEEGSAASGGVADVSEETRPWLVHGVVAIVVGLGIALFALYQDRKKTE